MKAVSEVKVGQRVGMVTGPGQWGRVGMCEQEGMITGTEVNKWEGLVAVIRWDGTDYNDATRIIKEDGVDYGIGVYLLKAA